MAVMRKIESAQMRGRVPGTGSGRKALYRWEVKLACGHAFERQRRQGDEIWAGDMFACPRCLVGERAKARESKASEASTRRTSASAGWVNPSTLGGKCRWCEGDVAPPRRTFCSEECVHEHRLRTDPAYARMQVFLRDRGVCASCGMDTQRMVRAIARHRWRVWRWCERRSSRPVPKWIAYDKRGRGAKMSPDCELARFCRLLGLDPPPAHRIDTLWDCDHETPVVEGGGECGMDNLRTLCVWCHRAETTKLARRRARAKAREKQPELFSDLDEDGTGLGEIAARGPADLADV